MDKIDEVHKMLEAQFQRVFKDGLDKSVRIAELEKQLQDHSAQAFSIGETYANALTRIAELEAQVAELRLALKTVSDIAAEKHLSIPAAPSVVEGE